MNLDLELSTEGQLLTSYAMFESLLCDSSAPALQGTHRALLPFLVTALKRIDHEIVTVEDVARRLELIFGLRFPRDVTVGLLKTAWSQGLLDQQAGVGFNYLTVNGEILDRWADTEDLASDLRRDHGAFIREFRRFGRDYFAISLDREDSEHALHSLMLDRIDAVSNVRDYSIIASDWSCEMAPETAGYILARFIEEEVRPGSELHEYLDRIAKGSALAVAIFYRGRQIDRLSRSMKNLRVFFDTPLVLSLLGYHKNEDKEAAEDLMQLVIGAGARPSVFEHTCNEIRNVLRGSVNDMRNAQHGLALESSMPIVERFVESALSGGSQSLRRSRYLLDAKRLPTILKELGFEIQKAPNDPLPDERASELADRIRSLYARDPSSRIVDFDVLSILSIHRLRSGSIFDSVDESLAVFVTSNPKLAKSASLHFGNVLLQEHTPHCYTSDSLSNLLWLKQPLKLPGVPWRQVVAYMYAGLYPGEELWAKYTEFLEELRSEEDGISEEDYFILRFTVGARQALMDDTQGNPGLLTVGSISEILIRAREQLASKLQAEILSKDAKIDGQARRVDELLAVLEEQGRQRDTVLVEVEELRASIPAERWAALEEFLEMRSSALAHVIRRLAELAVSVTILLSLVVGGMFAAFGVTPPVALTVLLAMLIALTSYFGYLNLKRDWNFDELEAVTSSALTLVQIRRLKAALERRAQ